MGILLRRPHHPGPLLPILGEEGDLDQPLSQNWERGWGEGPKHVKTPRLSASPVLITGENESRGVWKLLDAWFRCSVCRDAFRQAGAGSPVVLSALVACATSCL